MAATYQAILRGDKIEWSNLPPETIDAGHAVRVEVIILDDAASSGSTQGQQMAAALESLAKSQTFLGMDAAQWERDARADQTLPGRAA